MAELDRPDSRLPDSYPQLLRDIQARVRASQIRAAIAVNRELVLLYWSIGRDILAKQEEEGWGSKVIDRLGADLKRAFPDLTGFSPRNLKNMRRFAQAWPDEAIVQTPFAQLTWHHNVTLLEKADTEQERLWYAAKAVEQGWSRNMMVHQIESRLHQRQGQAPTNFTHTLPSPQSDLAHQLLKDPYSFDFLTLAEGARERDLERGLLDHIRSFLLELGVGFAFVGSQYRLEIGGDEFFLDLLFYHLRLRCYVAIDLKMGDFVPEFAGKMNFYLSAMDDLLRHPDDGPSIGLILCKGKNRVVAEYTLRDMNKPIGISNYELAQALPDDLKPNLPTIEELEAELGDNERDG